MAEPCTSTSHEFDRCSRFTAFRCDMLSYCWAQGASVRGEQDIGRTRSCADDCLVGGGQSKKAEHGSTIGPKRVYALRRPSVTGYNTKELLTFRLLRGLRRWGNRRDSVYSRASYHFLFFWRSRRNDGYSSICIARQVH